MITEERLKEFLNELTALSHKYGVIIEGDWDPSCLMDIDQFYNDFGNYNNRAAYGLSYSSSKKRYEAWLNHDLYNKTSEDDMI